VGAAIQGGVAARWVLSWGGCCLEVGAAARWVLLQGGA